MPLNVTLQPDMNILIGKDIKITFRKRDKKRGWHLVIDAPRELPIVTVKGNAEQAANELSYERIEA